MEQRASFVHIVRRTSGRESYESTRKRKKERERERQRIIPRFFQVQLNVSKRYVPSTPADRLPSSFSSLSSLPFDPSFVDLPSPSISLLKPGTCSSRNNTMRVSRVGNNGRRAWNFSYTHRP